MDVNALEVLKSSGSEQVRIRFRDGETMRATVFLISEEDKDVIRAYFVNQYGKILKARCPSRSAAQIRRH
jgi:hypothetical protein